MNNLLRKQARDRLRRSMLLGTATFVVSLCFFSIVFILLLGHNWKAGAAAWSTAAALTGLELWRFSGKRMSRKRRKSEIRELKPQIPGPNREIK